VRLKQRPRYILEDKCTGCGTCVEYCPVEYPDPYNQNLSNNKAVHIYFSQAIPLIAYIDESCLFLKEKKCRICEGVCQNAAIDLKQQPKTMDIRVGAIVLSPGYAIYDPGVNGAYGYGKFANVVTSLDFERLLCATGPYEGEIRRSSDGRHPRRIAWIQCVGSRRVTPGDNSYCSAVCCTYTQKQVLLAKDHDPDTDCTVFHNDIRAFGKDFEPYFSRTAALPGVRFMRSYVSIVREIPESGNVVLRYATEDDGVKEAEFDMVVLSVGLNPPDGARELAEGLGITLNDHGFCRTAPFDPVATERPGVFVSGAFAGPVDIPESVYSASGAGARCGELLDPRRGRLTRRKTYPPEKDVARAAPRIGVFVCHCGANIGRVVDVPAAVEYALHLPHVVHAQEQLFSCANNAAGEIIEMVKEKALNRVVVAACSPRTLDALFRDTMREAGLNPYFFEMANIREHDAWVHAREPQDATCKAKDIIRMSVARAAYLEPLQEIDLPVDKAALVIGGGVAGMTCALSIAEQGHDVYLLEKAAALGGAAVNIHTTLEGLDVQAFVHDLVRRVYRHPLIHVLTDADITAADGYVGNFVTRVRTPGDHREIRHGAAVIAVGAEEYTPDEYRYGEDERVMTQLALEQKIAAGDAHLIEARGLVMIQCVGCRQKDREYCSRVCCSHAVKNALRLKALNPEMDITILFRDMRTYGLMEDYYREASENWVRFIRYEPDGKPDVKALESEGRLVLRVAVRDCILGQTLAIDADYLVLSAAVVPTADSRALAQLFKVTLGADGFFKEAHAKLRPVDFAADGVFLCGSAHFPKHINEAVSQACGAAGRALTLLAHDVVTVSGAVCEVNPSRCMGCGACIAACTYGAIDFKGTKQGRKAFVNPVLCKGDGLCNACCPSGAIVLKHFTDAEIISQIDAAAAVE